MFTRTAQLLAVIALSLFASCNSDKKNPEAAKELNDKAVKIMMRNINNDNNKDSLTYAVQLLDEAIAADNDFRSAYTNKVQCLCVIGNRRTEALATLDKLLTLDASKLEMKMAKGFILEKDGKTAEAQAVYNDALAGYEKKLADSPATNLRVNRAFVMLFAKDKETAVAEFNKVKAEDSTDDAVTGMAETFNSFDRQQFINSFCQ